MIITTREVFEEILPKIPEIARRAKYELAEKVTGTVPMFPHDEEQGQVAELVLEEDLEPEDRGKMAGMDTLDDE